MPFLIIAIIVGNIWMIIKRGKEKQHGKPRLRDSSWKDTIIGLSIADAVFIGLFVFFFCAFEPHWYIKLCYVLLGILSEVLLVGLMTQYLTGKQFLAWLVLAGLAATGLLGGYRYDQYLRDITLREYFRYETYTPFTAGSSVAILDEETALRFAEGDTLPRMDGATALYPVYAAFAQAVYPETMAEQDPWDIRKTVSCSTTSSAYRSIVDGKCDIIFVAGPSEEQEAYAAEKGVELIYTPIGREAFVFFVHPDNPIDGLSLDQIRRIYAGEITRWDQLGVNGLGRILAYQRDEGSGSQTALERFVMRDTPLMPADKENRVDGMGGIVESVSAYKNHRNAVGFSFRFYCTALMKGFDVKLLAVNGVHPTVESIENGTYPLASSFYAVTRSDADQNTLALMDWICGPQGQTLVEKAGYTPLQTAGSQSE